MISIIIPILNEVDNIEKSITHLLENIGVKSQYEIILVDGGSIDGTIEKVQSFLSKEINLFHSSKGRATQMNFGAKQAKGDILYFLHADSFPPKDFDHFILDEISKGHLAGCFRMQFDSQHWWLRLASWLTQFNWRASRGGDQSLFITRELFNSIGGYDQSFKIFEDQIIIKELYKRGQFKVINKKLISSARRYNANGIWKLQYHFWTIYVKRWFGASPQKILTYYKKYIK